MAVKCAAQRTRRKTLLVCSTYPFPETTGGRMRTANFIRFFNEIGVVDLAYWQEVEGERLASRFVRDVYFLEKKDYPVHFGGRAAAILGGRPYPVHTFSPGSIDNLFTIVASNDYDFIVIRYVKNAYPFFKLPPRYRKRILVDFDDVITNSLYETLFAKPDSTFKSLLHALNKRALLGFQKKCLGLGLPVFSSDFDKRRTAGENARASVVPNVYRNDSFAHYEFGVGFDNPNTLLFVGALAYEPNISGLSWFVENVYPAFKDEVPDARLLVVGFLGNASDARLKRCCRSAPDIELHTDVPDIKVYYRACRMVVVPLLQGGGTRIKILEAAMARRPVLSTPVGAEGLDLEDGRDLFLFSDAREFVNGYCKVAQRETYLSLIDSARKKVREKYSIANFNKTLGQAVSKCEPAHRVISGGG